MRKALQYALVVVGLATAAVTAQPLAPLAAAAVSSDVVATADSVASVSPAEGETVGVAYPVTIRFASPVGDRVVAQRSVSFSAEKEAACSTCHPYATTVPEGSFSWIDDSTVRWTPSTYWPSHATVTIVAAGFPHKFRTGAEVLGVASNSQHTFIVKIDGKVVKTMPASMGKPAHPTPVGSFTTLEKQNPVVMDSRTIGIPLNSPEGYKLTVYDAVRLTWGGVYVHSAPWSTASQGKANVSHGCINLSPDNAAWYYNTVGIGDPVIVQA